MIEDISVQWPYSSVFKTIYDGFGLSSTVIRIIEQFSNFIN